MEKFLKNQQIPLTEVIDPSTGQVYYAPQNVVYQDKNNTGSTRLKNVIVDQAISSSYFSGSIQNAISASYALTASYLEGGIASASYALTASYANYAETASSALNAQDILILVKNQSGNPIAKGVVVHITASGNSSDIPRVITASWENDNNSANTLGITNQAIANGAEGFVMTEGVLKGIDTNAFISGQLIYLGATGSIIGYAPQAPLHSVRLGQVVRHQSNNGSIYVRIDNGYELGELHDVVDTTTSSSYGDLLVKSGSVWTNSKQLTGSYAITGSLTATSFTGSFSGSTSAPGSDTQIIFNNGGILGATGSFVYSGSRVGIGKANPNTTLDVSGNTLTSGSSTWVSPGFTGGYISPGSDGISIGNNGSGVHIRVRNSNRTSFDQSCGFGGAGSFGMTTSDRITVLTGGTTSGQTGLWVGSSANSNIFKVQGDSRVGINLATATSALHVRGTGTTSATTALRIENANASASMVILDNGFVGVGVTSPNYTLDVSGSSEFVGNMFLTGSLSITGSAGTGSALYAYKSGSTVLDIQGSQGQLFSVTDALSGSLMSVNDVSGLPILEVFSDDRVVMGTYGAPGLTVSGSTISATGSLLGTASLALTSSYVLNAVSASFARTASFVNPLRQTVQVTGSILVSGSNPLLRLNGSGSELMSVDGASGRLFTVSDDLTNSLFSVNTIAGLPVIEAYATNDVFLGKYGVYPIKTVTSGTLAVITGSLLGTASFATSASWAPSSPAFPFTGSARITGSLNVIGDTVITGSFKIKNGTTPVMDTTLGYLYDIYGNASVNFGSNQLLNYYGINSVNWGSYYLIGSSGNISVDWDNRILNDSTGAAKLRWNSTGVQVTGSLTVTQGITGSLLGTASFATSASFARTASYVNPLVQNVIITGSLTVSGSSTLTNIGPAIFTGSFIVNDGIANLIDTTNYVLNDLANGTSVNWNDRSLSDSGLINSIDWGNRQLLASNGASAIIWDVPNQQQAVEVRRAYFKSTPDIAAQYEFSLGQFNAEGRIITGATFTSASNYDFVYLDTSGVWFPVDNITDRATKMLGIAFDIGGSDSVLLEGHVTITDTPGTYQMPAVASIAHGRPIYVSSSAFATTVTPSATGEYVRILGHTYYQNTNDPDVWIMNFRPDHTWVEL